MAGGYVGVVVSDPWLQNQFTQVELRTLQSQFQSMRTETPGKALTIGDLTSKISAMKIAGGDEDELISLAKDSLKGLDGEVDFEIFLRVYLKLQGHAGTKSPSSAFLKASTTTLHTISESEKSSYVTHINSYLLEDKFLKKYLPMDPQSNGLFEVSKDGVLLCKLINVAVPGTIDERAINKKRVLNPWERHENHTLCLNSAKAIGCSVVNIGAQDLIDGRPHLVLGLISQIIKIQLLSTVNLRNTPQLAELVDDGRDMEELLNLPPEKMLLRWMNFQLKKTSFKRSITNFSSDVKDAEAYAHLLNVLAPEHSNNQAALKAKVPFERAKLVLEHADRIGCKRYLTAKDIIEGSPNLNLAFVAHIFQKRNGLSSQTKPISYVESADDTQISREERVFRLWFNSLGISTYISNVFEDLRNGWLLLEALEKVSPGIVCWKAANKPPMKMPFKKVENCNQVIKIGKKLKFSLVNVAGNDIVQGNKKLILAFLWQLMRSNILQLLKNLRFHSHGKEINDRDILNWANTMVKNAGRHSRMETFKDKSLSKGIFFLELLSAVDRRVVDWSLVTRGENDDEKTSNATYIISVARKLGCSIFLLPEDILQVNQKMMLTLTASIMYWHLKQPSEGAAQNFDNDSVWSTDATSSATSTDDSSSETSIEENASR